MGETFEQSYARVNSGHYPHAEPPTTESEWDTVSTYVTDAVCEASVRYSSGPMEYQYADGECDFRGQVTVHVCRNGEHFWECGRGHEHYETPS
jgi:hypothetical protein